MGIAGAGFGAAKALEDIIGEQMLRAQMAERQRAAMAQEALEGQRLSQNQQAMETGGRQRQEQIDLTKAGQRRVSNQDGVRRMIGEAIQQRTPMEDLQGMAFSEGIDLPQAPAKKLRAVTGIGPKGEPINKMVAEDEEVEVWRAPEKPRAAEKTKPDAPKAPGKLPVGMATAIAAAKTSLAGLDRLETLYSDDKVGPVAGRYNKIERGAPQMLAGMMPDAPKDFEEFAAESATLKNQVIQAITGAAVGVKEQERIMDQIPDVTNNPSVWKAKAKATRRNLQALMANQTQMGTGATEAAPGATVDAPAADEITYQRDPKTGKLVRVGG